MKLLSVAGDRLAILLDGAATNQQYTVMEFRVPPQAGPPPHVHQNEDELFHVLAGELTVTVDETVTVLTKGQSAVAPRGIPHCFKNTGTEETVVLITATPAGIEHYFEEVGHPLAVRDARPHPLTEEGIAKLIAAAPRYGLRILVPAPA